MHLIFVTIYYNRKIKINSSEDLLLVYYVCKYDHFKNGILNTLLEAINKTFQKLLLTTYTIREN